MHLRDDLEAGAHSAVASSLASISTGVGAEEESACDSWKEEGRGKANKKREGKKTD